jgi:predicted lysophospholipase L1 biosynthesis ABC-type transport system permease subunit
VRRLRWDFPEREIPKRPYRDSAIFYAVLATLVVVIAVATGGGVVRAVVIAVAAFVIATAFSWWRWHVRLRRQDEKR